MVGSTSWASFQAQEASNSSNAMTRASSLACSWPTPTHPRCSAATASGSHALGVEGLPARCRGLRYASKSEASHWRAQRKALSIRRRVGANIDGLDRPFPPKPRKMRWATYNRLRRVDARLQERWLLGAAGDLGRLQSRVKRR